MKTPYLSISIKKNIGTLKKRPSFTKTSGGDIVNQLIPKNKKSQMLGCQNILRGQFEKLKTVKDKTFKKAKVINQATLKLIMKVSRQREKEHIYIYI